MKYLTQLSLITFLFIGNNSFACSCDFYKKIDLRQLNNYDLVIKGTIISIEEDKQNWERTAKFKVNRSFKNLDESEIIIIKTGFDGTSCGLNFRVGQKWLIYGNHLNKNIYHSGLCTRSKRLTIAKNFALTSERVFLKNI